MTISCTQESDIERGKITVKNATQTTKNKIHYITSVVVVVVVVVAATTTSLYKKKPAQKIGVVSSRVGPPRHNSE